MSKKQLTIAERFQEMLDEAESRDSFHVDGAKLELSEQIFAAMENKAMSEAEFSRLLGVSRAYVNKILQGSANLTIKSLVKISRALDCEFKFYFAPNKKRAKPVKIKQVPEKQGKIRQVSATLAPSAFTPKIPKQAELAGPRK